MLGFTWINTKTPLGAFVFSIHMYRYYSKEGIFKYYRDYYCDTFFDFKWQFLDLFDKQVCFAAVSCIVYCSRCGKVVNMTDNVPAYGAVNMQD